jgi:hypothetical protein
MIKAMVVAAKLKGSKDISMLFLLCWRRNGCLRDSWQVEKWIDGKDVVLVVQISLYA